VEELINPRVNEIASSGATYAYWLMFSIPAFFAFVGERRSVNNLDSFSLRFDGLWWLFFIIITLFIGFRVQVGGDWGSYLTYYKIISSSPLSETFDPLADPSYMFLNYLSGLYGLGIYGVNFVSALIFSLGLFVFCRSLPRPFLALTAAIPYLVIVVGMGYTRQGIALGLIMLGLVAISRNKSILFFLLIMFAATFHKTAIIMLGIAGLASTNNKLWMFLWASLIVYFSYTFFLSDSFERFVKYYYEQSYQSSGALIRILMLILPASLLLFFFPRFEFNKSLELLWWWSAIISILLFILLFTTNASTAIDRIGLYLLPIQLIVFSYLPDIFSRKGDLSKLIILLIIFYYTLVLYVWLYFATFSHMWQPYRNALFEML
tara:strand:+ start:8642 stop:9772 length:1131 start_codon:yes stop_codon:yes gene_type:complete